MSKVKEPLTESYFYILLCLHKGPSHGYAIMQKTASLTNDRLKIGAGTMYGAFANLLKKGYVIESTENVKEDRRKLYEITDIGRGVLKEEVKRLIQLVDNAREIME